MPQEAYLPIGATDFTTSCTAYGPPDVDITWTFSGDDGTLPTGASTQSYSYDQTDNSIRSTLTIATIAAIHVGTYTCTSTADTSLTETFTLYVYGELSTYPDLSGLQGCTYQVLPLGCPEGRAHKGPGIPN